MSDNFSEFPSLRFVSLQWSYAVFLLFSNFQYDLFSSLQSSFLVFPSMSSNLPPFVHIPLSPPLAVWFWVSVLQSFSSSLQALPASCYFPLWFWESFIWWVPLSHLFSLPFSFLFSSKISLCDWFRTSNCCDQQRLRSSFIFRREFAEMVLFDVAFANYLEWN